MIEMSCGLAIHYQIASDKQSDATRIVIGENVGKIERGLNTRAGTNGIRRN